MDPPSRVIQAMTQKDIRVEHHPDFVQWTITRPQRGNGIGPLVARQLTSLLAEACQPLSPPKALVITAEPILRGSQKIWIAGGDLKELATIDDPQEARAFAKMVSDFLHGLSQLPQPVILAIDGWAIGGGAEFALAGDIRIATASSRFDFKQTSMGLPTGFGGAHRLCHLVGITRAQSLIYGAQSLDGVQAHAWGLIHAVADDAEHLTSLVTSWVRQLLAIDPRTFRAQKAMFHAAAYGESDHQRELEAQLFGEAWKNPTHRQRVDDFLQKKATR